MIDDKILKILQDQEAIWKFKARMHPVSHVVVALNSINFLHTICAIVMYSFKIICRRNFISRLAHRCQEPVRTLKGALL